MLDWEQAPLEDRFYPVLDNVEVQALRTQKNVARTRWRRTLVELTSAERQAARFEDASIAHEAHDEHLGALHEWRAAEATHIAARLGFPHAPLPPRSRRG
jgi:hypothetical protein